MDGSLYFVAFCVVAAVGYYAIRYNRRHAREVQDLLDSHANDDGTQDAATSDPRSASSHTASSSSAQPVQASSQAASSSAQATQEDSQAASSASAQNVHEAPKTSEERTVMDMWLRFLHDHNCDVQFDQDDNNVFWFSYQGIHFRVVVSNRTYFDLACPYIHSIAMDDYDGISCVRKVINEANACTAFTYFYVFDEQRSSVDVHMRRGCLVPQETRDADSLLSQLLNACFDARLQFYRVIWRMQAEEAQKSTASNTK